MSTSIDDAWPALSALAQAYFHEDWPDEYDTPVQVVDAYLASHERLAAQLLSMEIGEILESHEDSHLAGFFVEIHLLLEPGVDLNTHRGWLLGVAARASQVSSGLPKLSQASDLTTRSVWSRFTAVRALGEISFRAGWRDRHYAATRLVIEEFMCEQPDLARKLPDEINALLDLYDEEELGPVLRALGIDYEPTESLNTNKGWLTEVARRVQMPLDS